MSQPAVMFADPEARAKALLWAGMTGRPEAYATTSISVDPASASLAGDASHLQVELEGSDSTDYPILEHSQVRVTAYVAKGKRSNAKDLASLAQGLLLSHAGIFPGTGRSDVVKDPDTGNLMVWFLVRVDTSATPIAS